MVSTLSNLKKALEVYKNRHLQQEIDTDQELLAALNDLKVNSNPLFTCNMAEVSKLSFQTFYRELCHIFNFVYHKKNKQVDPIILKFHHLLQDFEDIMHESMDMNGLLSDYQYDLLKAELLEKFPKIKEALYKKHIPYLLLLEIQAAIAFQFNDSTSNLSYQQYIFFHRLLCELIYIADHTSDKDCTEGFIEKMIDINFNHPGFLNRCCDLIDLQLKDLSIGNQIEEMSMKLFRLSCASHDPKLHYNQMLTPLSDSLTQYLALRKTVTIDFFSIIDDDIPENSGLQTAFDKRETIVLLNYMFKANFENGKYSKIDMKNFFNVLKHLYASERTEEQPFGLDGLSDSEKISFSRQIKFIIAEIEKDQSRSLSAIKNKR